MVKFKGEKKRFLHLSPPRILTLSFVFMIMLGALLLNMPVASQNGKSVGFVNALFTATSANCVTGLTVVNTFEHWTLFGKVVILVLIQLGGLGLVTILTITMILLKKRVRLENRILIQAAFNQDNVGGMVRLVKSIVTITLACEITGAFLLTLGFYFSTPGIGALQALAKGVFHSISAFCNAGFDTIGQNSLAAYQNNLFINAVIMLLIIAGGLGFTVWSDLLWRTPQITKGCKRGNRWHFLTLHSKIAIVTTVGLILGGCAMFLLLEWNNPQTLGGLSAPQKGLSAMFQSVTLRTAGFYTVEQSALTEPSKLLSCLFMMIGGSPAGTAGGIKTVTIGVVAISIKSLISGKNRMEAFGRSLPQDLLQKALTVVFLMFTVVIISGFALYFTENGGGHSFALIDLIYETSSAAATVGLTTGVTPLLSSAGKFIVIICMFLGRLSPLTVVLSLNIRMNKNQYNIAYPHERVIIG